MKFIISLFCLSCLLSCSPGKKTLLQVESLPAKRITGTAFYATVASRSQVARDSFAVEQIISGNIPSFLKKFVPVTATLKDSTGKTHRAVFYVSPDYLSIGTEQDWARVPLSPMSAQKIADHFNCFLPTRKIVDLVYHQSRVKLAPVPMFAYRDSSVTMWQHHLIIEGQRKNREGLIAGIKKDLVISGKILRDAKPNRVAIYGWHQLNGLPIQPLYTGHVNWYVDYSHGARMIYRIISINGAKMDYTDVMQHPIYRRLICDEEQCDFVKYPY